MKIESLLPADIPHLPGLQPDGWMPIAPYYEFYASASFCNPVKCVVDNRIVGIGTSIEHRGTGWLAHIIVDNNFRGRGIGTDITRTLMNFLLSERHLRSLHLVATPMGEPLYRKLGFQREADYVFLKGGRTCVEAETAMQDLTPEFRKAGLIMDFEATSEDRSDLLEPHWVNGRFITRGSELTGFYLPTLGEGFILAKTPGAGLTLLREKHSNGGPGVIPEENRLAIEYLESNGYSEFRRGVRMRYGPALTWHPEMIYGRVGGNLG